MKKGLIIGGVIAAGVGFWYFMTQKNSNTGGGLEEKPIDDKIDYRSEGEPYEDVPNDDYFNSRPAPFLETYGHSDPWAVVIDDDDIWNGKVKV